MRAWPFSRRPQTPREPTVNELIHRRLDRKGEIEGPRWREEARRANLPEAEDEDPYVVLAALNRHHAERERPELERRAEALGLRSDVRDIYDLRHLVYEEERRQELLREERDYIASQSSASSADDLSL